MYLTLIDIVLLTSIIQSLALAVFLLLPSNIGLISNRLLVATLVFFAAGLGEIFLYGSGLALQHPNFAYLGTLIGLLQAGTLYLYAQSLMYQNFRLRGKHLVHTLLFWVVGAIFLVEYYLQPSETKVQILLERDHPGVLTSPLLAVAIASTRRNRDWPMQPIRQIFCRLCMTLASTRSPYSILLSRKRQGLPPVNIADEPCRAIFDPILNPEPGNQTFEYALTRY